MTSRKRQKKQIQRLINLAYYDQLTGLPNRLLFQEESVKAMEISLKTNKPLAVFLIDLDNFKPINDTHGHEVGDLLLQQVAYRLEIIRRLQCNLVNEIQKCKHDCKCLVARLGGDEFVMVFENMNKSEAEVVANHIILTLKEPIFIQQTEIIVSASIGISIFPIDSNEFSFLLKAADLAMYVAKENGKNQFSFHESYMSSKIERRVKAELMIREIIETKNVELVYQPIFSVKTQQVVGFEALFRANNSKEKFSPIELITVAEQANLIIPLGTTIIQKACLFANECLNLGINLIVSVNISSSQLIDVNFNKIVETILYQTKLPTENLCLEITETMLMLNFPKSSFTLEKLRKMGIEISIDDFGKGYSSFNYLQTLPISKLKIDMSFIQRLGLDKKANAIIKSIILMAEALGVKTCAEGVETKLQLSKLIEYNCEYAQGYFKSPPLTPDEFLSMLKQDILSN